MLKEGKLYYNINEVAQHLKVNASLIRFWEKEFPLLTPKKNSKGNRQYTKEDIDLIETIYHLVKERGFTLQGAHEKLKQSNLISKQEVEVVQSLNKIKQFLLNIKNEL